jgi:hypothetical protein
MTGASQRRVRHVRRTGEGRFAKRWRRFVRRLVWKNGRRFGLMRAGPGAAAGGSVAFGAGASWGFTRNRGFGVGAARWLRGCGFVIFVGDVGVGWWW